MSLVIVGEFDSTNVGDQLIADGQRKIFATCCEQLRLLPLENTRPQAEDPQGRQTRKTLPKRVHRALYSKSVLYRHAVESLLYMRNRDFYRIQAEKTLASADILIIGGGQLMSDGTLRMLRRLDALTMVARERGIPIAAFGTGMARTRSPISRTLMRRILRRLDGPNFFRDERSRTLALGLSQGLDVSPEPTPDCAIAGIVSQASLAESPPLIGVAPMAPAILARSGIPVAGLDLWWLSVIEQLLESGETPVLFSTGVDLDADYAGRLQEALARKGRSVAVLDRPRCGKDLLGQLRCMKRVLAQRLHASISYYALGGTPASVTWDPKVEEFYKRVALSRRVIRPGEVDPEGAVHIVLSADAPEPAPVLLARKSLTDARLCISRLTAKAAG